MDIVTYICLNLGIFTVPVSGAWRVSFSLVSKVWSGYEMKAQLLLNDRGILESAHHTYSGLHPKYSTGGREVTVEASAGDTIYLKALDMGGEYTHIYFCAEYIPKM